MKRLALVLLAVPALSYGQVVGWADCKHTRTDEKMLVVFVALMEGDVPKRHATILVNKDSLGTKTVSFGKTIAPFTVTGMRIACGFAVEDADTQSLETSTTVNWRKHKHLPIKAGAEPKLVVRIEETSPGLLRASIGKAP